MHLEKSKRILHLISDHISHDDQLWFCFGVVSSWTSPRKVNFGVWNMIFVNWLVPWYCCCFVVCSCHGGDRRFTKNAPERCANYLCMLHVVMYYWKQTCGIHCGVDFWTRSWWILDLSQQVKGETCEMKNNRTTTFVGFWSTLLNRIPGLFWFLKASDSWKKEGIPISFYCTFLHLTSKF